MIEAALLLAASILVALILIPVLEGELIWTIERGRPANDNVPVEDDEPSAEARHG